MCRFIAYKGSPELMSQFLYEPENSIIRQSYGAKEIDEPLNGDGFGVGWYDQKIDALPGVFVSVSPAWNNRNLQYISKKVMSTCMVAHVRAASVGVVSETNCHPFHFDRFLMMHNGGIERFDLIKRNIVNRLSDSMYSWIQGQTDSEHFFALFLDKLLKQSTLPTTKDMAVCLEQTFTEILQLMREHNISDPAYFNMVVTDGKKMVGSRFVSDKEATPLSLHHSENGKFICEKGVASIRKGHPNGGGVILASEKLTAEEEDWRMVPEHHFVMVEENQEVHFRPIKV